MVCHVRIDSVNSHGHFKNVNPTFYVNSYIIMFKCDKNGEKCLLK
jgi:hypothetical protein